jgi:hypothetical protein
VDDGLGVVDADAGAVVAYLGQDAADRSGVTDQDELAAADDQRSIGSTEDDLFGGLVAPHGIDDDPLHQAKNLARVRALRNRLRTPGPARDGDVPARGQRVTARAGRLADA